MVEPTFALDELVETNIRKLAKGKPYTQVTSEYLSLARDHGWGRDEENLLNIK